MTSTPQTYYKVLKGDQSCHGGAMTWSLPQQQPDGTWTPGDWHEVSGDISLCSRGLHLTNDPAQWWTQDGLAAYVAEYDSKDVKRRTGGDKIAVRRARLARRLTAAELVDLRIYTEGEWEVRESVAAASGSATVTAYGSATVTASGSATVTASGSATVTAYGSATVTAYGSATVTAYDSATVTAYDSATVTAYDSATVTASGSATVTAYDSATVTAYGSATVTASGSATVTASGSATVTASGSATVTASGSATAITFWGGVGVTLEALAVWVDRSGSVPVCRTAEAREGTSNA